MKKLVTYVRINLSFVIGVILIVTSFPHLIFTQNLLNGPEGIVFDATHNRYLVANAGNGRIVQIDSNGVQSNFLTGISLPLGMHIVDSILYISTNSPAVVKGFDLDSSKNVMNVPIPSALGLSGISSDTSGNLYVANQGGSIYKVRINSQTYSTFANSGLPGGPQGVLVEPDKNRLLVVGFQSNSPIVAVSLSDSTVSNVVNTSIGQFSTIIRDDDNNYYVSSWRTGAVHKYDPYFTNPPVLFSDGHSQPTGLCYTIHNRVLAVSNYGSNTVSFIPVDPNSVEELTAINPKTFDLYQNYPNPFNPATTISYSISEAGFVTIKIYDIPGNEIATLVKEEQIAGNSQIKFDAANLTTGIYFCRLHINSNAKTMKMVLLK